MIPAINDDELEAVLQAARDAGASSAGYILLRLPHELKELFAEWLEHHYPDRKAKVLHLIRETRGGELYDSSFGTRSRPGRYAELLGKRFEVARNRLGLATGLPPLDPGQFSPPPRAGDQLSLF